MSESGCFCAFVERHIVHHDNMVFVQPGTELPFQPPVEDFRVAWTFEQERFFKRFSNTGGDQGSARPSASGDQPIDPLALRSICIAPRHGWVKATFIEVHKGLTATGPAFPEAQKPFPG